MTTPRESATATLALDVGGTKMAAGIVSSDHEVLDSAVTATPVGGAERELYEAASFVLKAVLANATQPVRGLGAGCGGPMQWPSGVVSPLNMPGWRAFPLAERLAADFGLPVRVHNDAVCLTIAEHLVGAGRGRSHVLGLVVATGVGGGLILGGRLVDGAGGNAGHIGHVVVDPAGPQCSCGGRGCLESVARGPALVAWAQAQGWSQGTDAVALATSARSGDPIAAEAFQRAGSAIGVALASGAALLDLDVISIGGGLTHAADLLLPALMDSWTAHAGLDFVQRCRVVLAPPDAGLIGAAGLFTPGYWSPPTDSAPGSPQADVQLPRPASGDSENLPA